MEARLALALAVAEASRKTAREALSGGSVPLTAAGDFAARLERIKRRQAATPGVGLTTAPGLRGDRLG